MLADLLGVSRERVACCLARDGGVPPDDTMTYTSLDSSRLAERTSFRPPDPMRLLRRVFRAVEPVPE